MARAKAAQLTPTSSLTLDQFPALQISPVNNLTKGESISLSDLVKVKVPAGGITQWIIDAVDGQQMVPQLEGIVIAQTLIRALYAKPFEESGGLEAPICFSADSITATWNQNVSYPENLLPFGVPSERCFQCPLAQWVTRPKGRGQACQQRRLFLFLARDTTLPFLVSIPSSGLKIAKAYLIGLQAMGYEHWEVLTALSLIETKNVDGIKYAKPQFLMLEKLPATLANAVKVFKANFEQQISTQQLAATYPVLPASDESLAA